MYILKTDPLSHQKKEHEVSTLAQGHLSLLLDDSSDLSKRDNSNLGYHTLSGYGSLHADTTAWYMYLDVTT